MKGEFQIWNRVAENPKMIIKNDANAAKTDVSPRIASFANFHLVVITIHNGKQHLK
jgi:hypothetical protein